MKEEKSRFWIYVWLIILSIIIITNASILIFRPEVKQEEAPPNLLTANNLSLECIEYNKKTVLRYNVTCESCGLWFTEGDYCRSFSHIKDNKSCWWDRLFISAEPVEIEIDDTCKQYGLFTERLFTTSGTTSGTWSYSVNT